jgi:hypothetical protein
MATKRELGVGEVRELLIELGRRLQDKGVTGTERPPNGMSVHPFRRLFVHPARRH